jgi:biotin carboxyl carrier protein
MSSGDSWLASACELEKRRNNMNSYFITLNNNEYTVEFEQDGALTLNGRELLIDVRQLDERTFSILIDGTSTTMIAEKSDDGYRLLVNGKQLTFKVESERGRLLKQFDNQRSLSHQKTEIKAPMPALVVRVEVEVGQEVKAGQGLLILEAMKMENEIKSHSAGIVKTIYATKGKPVEKGELLILLE